MDIVHLLREAYEFAASFSDDEVTQNGAIIVSPSGNILMRAANQFPHSVEPLADRLQRPRKYDFLVHAEQNAIALAARSGIKLEGAVLVCPWAPCNDCAKLVIQAGIQKLVAHQQMHARSPDRWRKSIEKGVQLLAEANVAYQRYAGRIGDVTNCFNGERWEP